MLAASARAALGVVTVPTGAGRDKGEAEQALLDKALKDFLCRQVHHHASGFELGVAVIPSHGPGIVVPLGLGVSEVAGGAAHRSRHLHPP